MSKEELFAVIVANFVKSSYDIKSQLRVIDCCPMNKEVMFNDIMPFVDALKVEVKEDLEAKASGEKFIKKSFEWEEVTFFAYYEN